MHGFNTIYLRTIGKWIRVDPRGNKFGVNAQFSIKREKLAFNLNEKLGEYDNHIVYVKPNKNVIDTLNKYREFENLKINFPNVL